MTKQEFLDVLKSRLAVLEPSEQQDILDEYAYHIDMRVAGGLTEEQAIRDFGDLEQLVSLIYEAYHVNPNYQPASLPQPEPQPAAMPDAKAEQEPDAPSAASQLKSGVSRGFRAIGDFFRRLWAGLGRGVSAVGRWFAGLGHKIAGLFHRTPKSEQDLDPIARPAREPVLPKMGQAAGRAGNSFLDLCKTLLQLSWNALLLLCALPFAAAMVAGLIALGLVVVLLVQGYPLMGPLLVLTGGLFCCAAILALGTNLIHRRVSQPENTDREEASCNEEND